MAESDDAFDLFLKQARRVKRRIERERFSSLSPDERPGSAADTRMRRKHQARVDAYWERRRARDRLEAVTREAAAYKPKRTQPVGTVHSAQRIEIAHVAIEHRKAG